jgi:hypothetical protein
LLSPRGKQKVKIFTDGSKWNIASKPDWCQVSMENDYLFVTCASNKGISRQGSIRLYSDNLEKWITINQNGNITGQILNVNVNHLQREMKISVDFFVHGMQNVRGYCVVYFFYSNHRPVTRNGNQLTKVVPFIPLSSDWNKSNLEILVPTREFNPGDYYFTVKLLDSSTGGAIVSGTNYNFIRN